jgi:hypothetical protein
MKETLLAQIYADQSKVQGVDLADASDKQRIYEQYVASFKEGVYNYIKEEYGATTQTMASRKYFSGGFGADAAVLETVSS